MEAITVQNNLSCYPTASVGRTGFQKKITSRLVIVNSSFIHNQIGTDSLDF